MVRLVPSLDQFTEDELIKPDKKTLRKVKSFTYTVSYAILAELQRLAKLGDKVAVNTLYYDKQSAREYFKFVLILNILNKQNTKVREVEEKTKKERKIYSVRYWLDDEGKPILIDPIDYEETKLNRNSAVMFG